MANINADMNKISRNLAQINIPSTFGVDASGNTTVSVVVTSGTLLISYVPAAQFGNNAGADPMMGVSGNVSPYLGIGVASPGQLQIKGGTGGNSLAAIFTDQNSLQVLKFVEDIGNDVIIQANSSTAQLAYIVANPDWKMMGQ